LNEITTEKLFTLKLDVATPLTLVGDTPNGNRRIARINGGEFTGENLQGTVHSGGGDWLLMRPDGVLTLDVRVTLETSDGALIFMTYRGLRHGPDAVMERLNSGQEVDPSEYYFRITPSFETGDNRYAWLNQLVAVGTGHRLPEGPVYDIYKVL
jgi:hypothetical protein